jgi:hypothetical protein
MYSVRAPGVDNTGGTWSGMREVLPDVTLGSKQLKNVQMPRAISRGRVQVSEQQSPPVRHAVERRSGREQEVWGARMYLLACVIRDISFNLHIFHFSTSQHMLDM